MRDKLLKQLGIFPKNEDLKIEILEKIEKSSYIQILISYHVEVNEKVNSYLLVPKRLKKKNPAILAIHQHGGKWSLGKSEVVGLAGNRMFSYGLDLVKRGFVVLAPDLLGFEERIPENFNQNKNGYSSYERFVYLKYLYHGSTLQAKYIHDLSVAIDVLESLSYVDNNNIGAIGHSLGGQEAIWISWYDYRIKATVSSCGVGTLDSIFKNELLHNFSLYIPGMEKICDMDEIINQILINNQSVFILSGLHDYQHFPLEGIKQIKNHNEDEANFESIIFNGGHEFRETEKKITYQWLQNKLKDNNQLIDLHKS